MMRGRQQTAQSSVYVCRSPPPKSMASSSVWPQKGHSTTALDLERPRLDTRRLCHEASAGASAPASTAERCRGHQKAEHDERAVAGIAAERATRRAVAAAEAAAAAAARGSRAAGVAIASGGATAAGADGA